MRQKTRSCCSRLPNKNGLRLLAAAVLLLVLLTGCFTSQPKTITLRVGVTLYTQDDTFISIIVQELERRAQEMETLYPVKINLSVKDGKGSQAVQLEQLDHFVEQNYDIIFVNIVDRTAAAVLIDKAQAADVPIVFFNRQPVEEDIERWEKVFYVGARAEDSGVMQGELVLQAWNNNRELLDKNNDGILQYVMLEGEPNHQDATLRTQYSISTLTANNVQVEKLASDTANWNRGQAAARMAPWIEEFFGQIEVVFANNDDMALGAIDAIKEAGLTPQQTPIVVGIDATPPALEAIQEGRLYATVRNPAGEIAQEMLNLALFLQANIQPQSMAQQESSHYVWLPYVPVTAATIA